MFYRTHIRAELDCQAELHHFLISSFSVVACSIQRIVIFAPWLTHTAFDRLYY